RPAPRARGGLRPPLHQARRLRSAHRPDRVGLATRELMAAIAFRRLAADDLQQLYLWLGRPHVAKWYAPAPTSFAEIAAKYGPRTEDASVVRAFIVNVEGNDCGYAQAYPLASFPDYAEGLDPVAGAWGIDLFIADAWRLGHGLGAQVIRRFCDE